MTAHGPDGVDGDTFVVKVRTITAHRIAWFDLETTGLDPEVDRILEVALVITDGDLNVLHEQTELLGPTGEVRAAVVAMDRTCWAMHTENGLLAELFRRGRGSDQDVDLALSKALYAHWPAPKDATEEMAGRYLLAGSSVHFDAGYLRKYMPTTYRWLSHRHLDVSVLHRAAELWNPAMRMPKDLSPAKAKHRALDDIHHSIAVARWYREHVFGGQLPR
jgi:oligoribonuclease